MTNRVVLAYSGGLDTSVAIPYLAEMTGGEVVAVSLDLGQGGEDMESVRQRALDCGAVEAVVVDAKDEFAEEYCLPTIKANGMYQGQYPLVSAISRPLIVKHLVEAGHQFGGTHVAHGCTGKGNDQVRFEVGFLNQDPNLEIIAPARDYAWTRDKAIEYAEGKDLPIEQSAASPFSIDQNVWGRAVETGFLEDLWNPPTKDLYAYTEDPALGNAPDEVIISFEAGKPVAIDGRKVTVLEAIEEMNRRAGAQGIGRLDMVEDRLVGIKSREIYEAPGAMALIAAHRELENVTLEREQARFKKTVDQRWTELVFAYLRGRPNLLRVCLLIDARHGAKKVDEEVMDLLAKAAVPFQPVLTKADLVRPAELAARIHELETGLARKPAAIPHPIATSARQRHGLDRLRAELARLARPDQQEPSR